MKELLLICKNHLVFGCLVLLLGTACTQKGFLGSNGQNESDSIQSVGLDTSTKASDRPVDTGAGVPGYLVGCSIFNAQEDAVQVGCNLTDVDGTRIPTSNESWNSYDIRLPTDSPYGVTISKTIASTPAVWDVNFNFKGADKATLSNVARNSIYGYEYPNAGGQSVRIETVSLPPPAPVAPAAAVTTANACLGGSIVEGVCFVPVELSCSDYCSKAAMQPHPYVIARFGAAKDLDLDINKRACEDLYVKIRGNNNFRFSDTHSLNGWGCFEDITGRVIYDKTDTDPFEYPRIGSRRICGCQ